ncbi:MAG: isopentenyl phosphate kinase family protein [Thaumarchaeota archaeon]|nr:isopentenyl phosphate kinase family protein [Nitrososphaerota archaeon]MDE1831903.1 isopentenyl phosphate kinase family protein [Nitrososphaerota archaeon]MDE1840626.1 isopentenyl phosphate kinase family protein [Nitrososphaerota archaeon]MDE1878386.1 isopentenyl phosphate kinase family protein [Nitrososphaerota archaeon]
MILIKLGGSIITNKEKPLTSNRNSIRRIATSLKNVNEPLVIVHGGGSFGHYWSVKYDMHTRPERHQAKGVAVVKNSMIELNSIVLESFLQSGLKPYCLPPSDFMIGDRPLVNKVREIPKIAKTGLMPISYGDVMWYGKNKFYILSGDRIMGILSKLLHPRLAIFVTNVDGVYLDMKSKKLLKEITTEKPVTSKVSMDVTGGMSRKIKEAFNISKHGTDVFFVNGNIPKRIRNAINGKSFEGTIFRG